MIEGVERHLEVRDSGVPWLGMIPAHWLNVRLSSVMVRMVTGPFGSALHAEDYQVGGTPVVNPSHMVGERIVPDPNVAIGATKLEELSGHRISKGDVLFARRGELGRCSLVTSIEEGWLCGTGSLRCTPHPDRVIGEYLVKLFAAGGISPWLSIQAVGSTMQNLNTGMLGGLVIPLPPLDEQRAIVRFLDYADRRIRKYIAAKRKLIALLEEQKRAIIDRAVRRGLDPNARLKDSGVAWIGMVPAQWGIHPAKRHYVEFDVRSQTGAEVSLSVSHLTGVTPRSEKNVTMFKAESYVGHKLCAADDLVINTLWAWMGALGVARTTGIVSPAYGVYRPRSGSTLRPAFAELLFATRAYIDEFRRRSTGIVSSRLRLYPDEFLRIPLIVPPSSEQDAIVERIRTDLRVVMDTVAVSSREIELLREYRTRLISDVVTGKLDVRDAAARLPDESSDELGAEAPLDDADADATEAPDDEESAA